MRRVLGSAASLAVRGTSRFLAADGFEVAGTPTIRWRLAEFVQRHVAPRRVRTVAVVVADVAVHEVIERLQAEEPEVTEALTLGNGTSS